MMINKFGRILTSRPAGRDAFLSAKAYLLHLKKPDEKLILDFEGVDVLGPSWADEFITPLKNLYGEAGIEFANTKNESVVASIDILDKSRVSQ
ncbi:MAG: DUF4325 domain-containing protein [Candidatus Margulisiibacteriota bacterium]